MQGRDVGGGGVVGDVLRGKTSRRHTVTIRLAENILEALRARATDQGISLNAAVEQALAGRELHPKRTVAAVDAGPWTALGYRISRALAAVDTGNADDVKSELQAARAVVASTLLEIREQYDAALDAAVMQGD